MTSLLVAQVHHHLDDVVLALVVHIVGPLHVGETHLMSHQRGRVAPAALPQGHNLLDVADGSPLRAPVVGMMRGALSISQLCSRG